MGKGVVVGLLCIYLVCSFIVIVPSTNEASSQFPIQNTHSLAGDSLIKSLIGSPINATVTYSGSKNSVEDHMHWLKRWITPDRSLIEIEYDPIRLEVFSLVLPIGWNMIHVGKNVQSNESLQRNVQMYLTSLENDGHFSFPEDAVLKHVRRDSLGWVVEWMHVSDDIVIVDDYCRVMLDSEGTFICCFSKQWTEITVSRTPAVLREDAFHLIRNITGKELSLTNAAANLRIINHEVNQHLIWNISTDTSEYWIDAATSELIYVSEDLKITDNKDVFVYDPIDPTSYATADSIYDRMKTALSYSHGGSAHYYEDQSIASIADALVCEEVFSYIGHGDGVKENDKWYTGITTTTGLMLPRHLPEDLSTIRLAHVCSCYSYADQYWLGGDMYVDVEKNLCQGFLDNGAKCVFGWKKSIDRYQAQIFTVSFFDCAVNGYSFQACFQYAYSKVNSDTQVRARIGGDTSLYLPKDDLPGNSMDSAFYLGSGPGPNPLDGLWFLNMEEGLWGISGHPYTDVDYYSVLLTEPSTHVELWVTPLVFHGSLDAVIEVYDSSGVRIIYMNLGGMNIGEYCCWEGIDWYYIKVTHGSIYTHGGSYDFSMHVFMLS